MRILSIVVSVLMLALTCYAQAPTPTPPASPVQLLRHSAGSGTSMISSTSYPDVALGSIILEESMIWWDENYWTLNPDPAKDHDQLTRYAFAFDDGTLSHIDVGLITRDDDIYFFLSRSIEWGDTGWDNPPDYRNDYIHIADHVEAPTEWPDKWPGAWFFGGTKAVLWNRTEDPYAARVNIHAAGSNTTNEMSVTGILVYNAGDADPGYYRRGAHIITENYVVTGTAISVDSEILNSKYGYALYAHGNSGMAEALIGVYSEAQGSGTNYALVGDGGYIVIADIGGIDSFKPETWLGLNTDHMSGGSGVYIETNLEVDLGVYFDGASHFLVPQNDGTGSTNGDMWFDTDSGTLRYMTGDVQYEIPLYTPVP